MATYRARTRQLQPGETTGQKSGEDVGMAGESGEHKEIGSLDFREALETLRGKLLDDNLTSYRAKNWGNFTALDPNNTAESCKETIGSEHG